MHSKECVTISNCYKKSPAKNGKKRNVASRSDATIAQISNEYLEISMRGSAFSKVYTGGTLPRGLSISPRQQLDRAARQGTLISSADPKRMQDELQRKVSNQFTAISNLPAIHGFNGYAPIQPHHMAHMPGRQDRP
jgi:hypothetical protein